MGKGRWLRRILLWTVLLGILVVVALYAIANRRPTAYQPARLSPGEQQDQIYLLANKLMDFGNPAGSGEPFTWTLTADEFNAYLASMDTIAAHYSGRAIEPSAEVARVGLEGLTVSMRSGVLTVMARYAKYDKIISVDLVPEFNALGEVRTRITQLRIGDLPVPQSFVNDEVAAIRERVERSIAKASSAPAAVIPVRMDHLAGLLQAIMASSRGQYVKPEIVWPIGHHAVQIDRIDIDDGVLTVHAVPAARPARAPATSRPADGATTGRFRTRTSRPASQSS